MTRLVEKHGARVYAVQIKATARGRWRLISVRTGFRLADKQRAAILEHMEWRGGPVAACRITPGRLSLTPAKVRK